jgi:hypothetical protein
MLKFFWFHSEVENQKNAQKNNYSSEIEFFDNMFVRMSFVLQLFQIYRNVREFRIFFPI